MRLIAAEITTRRRTFRFERYEEYGYAVRTENLAGALYASNPAKNVTDRQPRIRQVRTLLWALVR